MNQTPLVEGTEVLVISTDSNHYNERGVALGKLSKNGFHLIRLYNDNALRYYSNASLRVTKPAPTNYISLVTFVPSYIPKNGSIIYTERIGNHTVKVTYDMVYNSHKGEMRVAFEVK